jgi:hypothetical protein
VAKHYFQMLVKFCTIREKRNILVFLKQTAGGYLELMCDFYLDPLFLKHRRQKLKSTDKMDEK